MACSVWLLASGITSTELNGQILKELLSSKRVQFVTFNGRSTKFASVIKLVLLF